MLVRLVVHRDLESLLDVLFELFDVLQQVSSNKGIIHEDPNVDTSLGALDLHKETGVVDGFQVTIISQMLRVSFIIGASGIRQTINIILHSVRLVRVSIEGENDESRELDVEGFRVWG